LEEFGEGFLVFVIDEARYPDPHPPEILGDGVAQLDKEVSRGFSNRQGVAHRAIEGLAFGMDGQIRKDADCADRFE
jgi:hypothetical protein